MTRAHIRIVSATYVPHEVGNRRIVLCSSPLFCSCLVTASASLACSIMFYSLRGSSRLCPSALKASSSFPTVRGVSIASRLSASISLPDASHCCEMRTIFSYFETIKYSDSTYRNVVLQPCFKAFTPWRPLLSANATTVPEGTMLLVCSAPIACIGLRE